LNQKELNKLKDWDGGSYRDITFSELNILKAENAIEWFCEKYKTIKSEAILSDESITISPVDFFNENYQYMLLIGESDIEPINRIQFMISPAKNNLYFLELTFFPENINLSDDILKRLNDWFKNMDRKIQPKEYYVRFEGYWTFGDISNESGVIFYRI